MARLRLSTAARADLVEIRKYSLLEFGHEVADTYLRGLNTVFALLRERPFAGASRADLGDGLRCFTHRRNRIFYRIESDLVLVVRIVHHTQSARRALNT